MDISEIRQAFARSANVFERTEAFRRERVHKVLAGESPVVLPTGAKVFVHLVPLATDDYTLDFSNQYVYQHAHSLQPLDKQRIAESQLNFDGLLNTVYVPSVDPLPSYMQLFRNGAIEFCDTYLVSPDYVGEREVTRIQSPLFEKYIVRAVHDALTLYKNITVPFPIAIFIAITNVRGYIMYSTDETINMLVNRRSRAIDRDNLFVSGQVINEPTTSVAAVLQPLFNTIWNATGLARSLAYDESRTWKYSERGE